MAIRQTFFRKTLFRLVHTVGPSGKLGTLKTWQLAQSLSLCEPVCGPFSIWNPSAQEEDRQEMTDYALNVKPGEIADLHDGEEPKPLRELWLEGKLTSPGAAQQGYWAHREYLERMEGIAGEETPGDARE